MNKLTNNIEILLNQINKSVLDANPAPMPETPYTNGLDGILVNAVGGSGYITRTKNGTLLFARGGKLFFINSLKQLRKRGRESALGEVGVLLLGLSFLTACENNGGGYTPTTTALANGGVIINGTAGNDVITSSNTVEVQVNGGAGNDTIDLTASNAPNIIRGGAGVDNIKAGAGDDIIVVVGNNGNNGTYTDSQLDVTIGATTRSLRNIITLADVNSSLTQDMAQPGEVINGGAGNNILVIYGQVNLTNATITGTFTQITVHSQLTIGADQLANNFSGVKIIGDGTSTLKLAGTGNINLHDITQIQGIKNLDIAPGVNIIIPNGSLGLLTSGVLAITGSGTIQAEQDLGNNDLHGLVLANTIQLRENVTLNNGVVTGGVSVAIADVGGAQIQLAGGNNAPVFANTGSASNITDTAGDDSFGIISGTYFAVDVDDNQSLSYSVVNSASNFGSFVFNTNGGYGNWSFTPNDSAIEQLTTATTTGFTMVANDGNGGATSQTINITINGANDRPVLATPATASITDTSLADSGLSATGMLTASDRDSGQTLTFTLIGNASTSSFGSLTLNNNGAYSFTANNSAVDALGAGVSSMVSFAVQVSDGSLTHSQVINFAINGANDTPSSFTTMNYANINDTTAADVNLGASGVFSVSDRDRFTYNYSIANGASVSEFGSLTINATTGSWVFDANESRVDVVADGATPFTSFTLVAFDGISAVSQTLHISINGADDTTASLVEVNDASEFRINTYTTNWQNNPTITALSDGGFVVAWESIGQDGSSGGMYGQRYNSAGVTVGAEFRINTYTTDAQYGPTITALSDGGFVVVWGGEGSGDDAGIFGQRYDATGTAVGGEFRINTYTFSNQRFPTIAALSDGGFVVSWFSLGQDNAGYEIYGQRYDEHGMAVGGEFKIGLFSINPFTTFSHLSLIGLNDGGFIAVWPNYNNKNYYGKRFDANGHAVGDEFFINNGFYGSWYPISITALSDGGFVVVRDGGGSGDYRDIYGQRYDAQGVAVGAEFRVNTYTANNQYGPTITALSDGGFVVAWESNGQDGSFYGIYGQRYNSAGVAVGAEFRINTYTTSWQNNPTITALSDGGFVVAWASNGQDGSYDGIYAKRFDASGNEVKNSIFYGTPQADAIMGTINGDVIYGGAGADSVTALAGDDLILGGAGDDVIDGGDGNDTADFSDKSASFTLTLNGATMASATFSGGEVDTLQNIENIIGGSGSDSITGDTNNNKIAGGAGDDVLDGGAGNDTADFSDRSSSFTLTLNGATMASATFANGEVDTIVNFENIIGGAGNDSITGDANTNILHGGAGNDTLNGGDGNDTIDGGAGNDILTGGAGVDTINGGDGNDYFSGISDDIVNGGNGIDTADFSDKTASFTLTLNSSTIVNATFAGGEIITLQNIENIIGGAGNDSITGDIYNNILNGGAGNDTINGGAGNDTIIGGAGDDILNGGDGNDTLDYSDKTASIAITLNGATQTTMSVAGTAEDMFVNFENIIGGAGNDSITGDANANILNGGAGGDSINGGAGGDSINGGAGDDILNGGDGNDTLDYSDKTASIAITLNGATQTTMSLAGTAEDILVNFENIIGGSGNDSITGDANNNILNGGDGDDILTGGSGNDTIDGGAGNDIINGGDGNDVLMGGLGNDTIDGGTGDDVITGGMGSDTLFVGDGNDIFSGISDDILNGGDGLDTVDFSNKINSFTLTLNGNLVVSATFASSIYAGSETITLQNIENIIGGAGSDSITGDANANIINGGAGNDILNGGDGNDTLDYSDKTAFIAITLNGATQTTMSVAGTAEDMFVNFENIIGGAGNDSITGDANANILKGGDGDDILAGDGGNDILTGGSGNDTLSGGDGNDTFVFTISQTSNLNGRDVISDFGINSATDTDKLQFSSDWGLNTQSGVTELSATTTDNFTIADGKLYFLDFTGVTVNDGFSATAGTDIMGNFFGASGKAFNTTIAGNTQALFMVANGDGEAQLWYFNGQLGNSLTAEAGDFTKLADFSDTTLDYRTMTAGQLVFG